MPKVVVRDNENFDDTMRRFKRTVVKSGNLKAVKNREFYVKPGVKRKLKSLEARKNRRKD